MEAEDDEEFDEDNPMDQVTYDEIDSSRMIDEEVGALILQKPRHLLIGEPDVESDHGDVHIEGANMDRYTGHEFSSCGATNQWIVLGAILEPPSGEAKQGGVQTILDEG